MVSYCRWRILIHKYFIIQKISYKICLIWNANEIMQRLSWCADTDIPLHNTVLCLCAKHCGTQILFMSFVLLFHADSRADIKYRMHPQNGTNCWPTWCPLFILLLISRTLGISPSLSSSLVYVLFPIVTWLSLVKFWIRSISWFALRNFPFCINLILLRQSSVLRNPLLETKIKSRYTDSLM